MTDDQTVLRFLRSAEETGADVIIATNRGCFTGQVSAWGAGAGEITVGAEKVNVADIRSIKYERTAE